MTNRVVTACSVACVSVLAASDVLAQCGAGYLELEQMLSQDSVAVVFSGTVTTIQRAGATETVILGADRAWKGPVTERMTIYKPIAVASGSAEFHPTIFERGKRYVVIAHRLSPAERVDLGLPDRKETFGTDMCGGGSRPFSVARQELGTIGPGRPIVEQPVRNPRMTPPQKIRDAAPVYPPDAAARGIRGSVIVQIMVDESGRVSSASVLRSIPLLDQAAIDCVMKWAYTPALLNGVPRPTTLPVVVNFTP
jgi:TonB family protein